MKTKIRIFIVCLLTLVFCNAGCIYIPHYAHEDLVGRDPRGGNIMFFQFHDTSCMNKIIVRDAMPWKMYMDENGYSKYVSKIGDGYVIPTYPKNLEGQPIFGERSTGTIPLLGYLNGDFYTLEELATNTPKLIQLKGGYYMYYPYVALTSGFYFDAEWKDLFNTDFNQVKIITSPYKHRYFITEKALVLLTKKSTKHFKGDNPEEITIDDVTEAINTLIETNRIENYCYPLY